MCKEGIQLGRTTVSGVSSTSISTTGIEAVPADPYRTCLIITPPTANRITLSDKADVTDGNGIVLAAGNPPLILDIEHHGNLVTKRLYGVSNTGSNVLGYAYSGIYGNL